MVVVKYSANEAKRDTDITNKYISGNYKDDEMFMQQTIDTIIKDIKERIRYGYYYTTVSINIENGEHVKSMWSVIDMLRAVGYSFTKIDATYNKFVMAINWAE